MRFGFVMPFGDAGVVADFAALAESTGWDAIFAWEAVWGDDAWIALTAAAMLTDRIRLGTMLTPIPRVRPWDLASRVSSLDRLSFGRVILGAGLGALHEGWTAFEADEGRRVRVEKMDEGLAIYAGLMAGQPFSHGGSTTPSRRRSSCSPRRRSSSRTRRSGSSAPQRSAQRVSRRSSGQHGGRAGSHRSSTATGAAAHGPRRSSRA